MKFKTNRCDRIALLHHTGGGNLGDDVTVRVVIDSIRQRRPQAEIVIFSMNPLETAQRHGVPSEPIRRHTWNIGYGAGNVRPEGSGERGLRTWINNTQKPVIRWFWKIVGEIAFLASSFRKLRRHGQLVISGGGQLTERSGPWGFPYAIFIWVMMARLGGVRCLFLSVGAGPLKHPVSRFLVACSLNAADYVSFRDAESKALARDVGFHGDSSVFPDNAYALQWSSPAIWFPDRSRAVVGLAPMPFPFCDPREYASGHRKIYEEYIRKFAIFAAFLAGEHCLELFGSDAGADASAIEDLRWVLGADHDIAVPPGGAAETLDDLLSRMSAMEYIVTCRFHGVVLAHILNKPVVAIAHHPKVTHLMQALGLEEYCVDIRTFDPHSLSESLAAMISNRENIRRRMASSLNEYRSEVNRQFDLLFPPAGDMNGMDSDVDDRMASEFVR